MACLDQFVGPPLEFLLEKCLREQLVKLTGHYNVVGDEHLKECESHFVRKEDFGRESSFNCIPSSSFRVII